ncbi:MAG: TlpA disulfide reductase family protein [Actinomycetota bacterium]
MPLARRRFVSVGAALAAIVLVAAACSSESDDAGDDVLRLNDPQDRSLIEDPTIETMPQLEGEILPSARLTDVDGNEVDAQSLIGEPLVMNFWFTTCPPCAKELADFAEVDDETEGVRFVGVNPSPADPIPAMVRFAEERGVTYDLFKDDLLELETALDITFHPVTVFVDSNGMIVNQTGVLDADGLRDEVAELLAHDKELDT